MKQLCPQSEPASNGHARLQTGKTDDCFLRFTETEGEHRATVLDDDDKHKMSFKKDEELGVSSFYQDKVRAAYSHCLA